MRSHPESGSRDDLGLHQAGPQPALPGGRIPATRPGPRSALRSRRPLVEARSFVPFQALELVWNGKVVASSEDREGTREMTLAEKVPVSGPGWLAARCGSPFSPTTAWWMGVRAHTSPVYVTQQGQELFSPPVAAYMLTLIEGAETWTNTLATPADADRMDRTRAVYRRARERLHQRLHAHGIAH